MPMPQTMLEAPCDILPSLDTHMLNLRMITVCVCIFTRASANVAHLLPMFQKAS